MMDRMLSAGPAQAAGAFEHEQNEDRAHDDVDRLTLEARGDEHRVADKDIDGHDRGEREEDQSYQATFLRLDFLNAG